MPAHWIFSQKSMKTRFVAVVPSDSAEKITVIKNRMTAKERATRLRKLKVRAYSSNENAVIAMPAVRISLMVTSIFVTPTNNTANI